MNSRLDPLRSGYPWKMPVTPLVAIRAIAIGRLPVRRPMGTQE
ncbi:MAG TPA: hypothetical protein VGQ20_06985 [Acidimicrobiales bacterium]|jgi:hypothetical protein|nr:hypothetical protein [Acidimicrobiales bacterium]